jgi:hypothetical protein
VSRPLAHQIATRARELIADQSHWTQGPLARRRDGAKTEPEDADAYSFCADGALMRAAHEVIPDRQQSRDFAMVVRTSIELFAELPDSVLIEYVNDCEGHQAIIELFDQWLAANPESVWHP